MKLAFEEKQVIISLAISGEITDKDLEKLSVKDNGCAIDINYEGDFLTHMEYHNEYEGDTKNISIYYPNDEDFDDCEYNFIEKDGRVYKKILQQLGACEKMENVIKLNSGELVGQSEIKVEQIRGELPRFLQLAVGTEEGKWYVQTTDVLAETMLSYAIVEGLESFHEAKKIAENISYITGMEIQYWNKEQNFEDTMLETENKYKSVEMYLKSKGIDFVPKGTSVWDNGAFAIHEALQGYVRHNETFKVGDIYPYSDEGRFFDKTFSSVIVSIDEESNSMLLRHEFEIPDLQEFKVSDVIDSVEDVLSDMKESKFNLYVDDTYAWDRYEGYIAHPTLTSEEVDELKQVAETLNTLRNTLEDMNGNNNIHEKTLNNLISQLDDVYEDVYKFYDELKKINC